MSVTDFYAVLEIEPMAKADEIRRAYYRLARLHHPDLQGSDATAEAHERFLLIQQAYEVLGTPVSRQKYDEEYRARQKASTDTATATATAPAKKTGSKKRSDEPSKKVSLDDIRNARQAFMRAEELLEAGAVERAGTVMQAVVRVMPDEPDYLSLFGYALALDGKRLHLARDLCRRASEAEPYNTEFKARLGYVYHRAGLQKTADVIFTEILAVQPNHPIAAAHKNGASNGSGGLVGALKRLFRIS